MAEYIRREAAVSAILGEPTDAHYPEWYTQILMKLPAADVARWFTAGNVSTAMKLWAGASAPTASVWTARCQRTFSASTAKERMWDDNG